MKNRYLRIFSLTAMTFFLNNAEGMNEDHIDQDVFSNNLAEIKDDSLSSDATARPEQFYENSPLVRNYKSEYEEKLRGYYGDQKIKMIFGTIVLIYCRLLKTTTLDQQRPLFARWEALALMLIQTQCPEVQSVHQVLDNKCYQQLGEPFLKETETGWNCFLTEPLRAKLRYFEIGRRLCQTLVSLQDLFMKQRSSNDDSIAKSYNGLLTLLQAWKTNMQYDRDLPMRYGFGMSPNLSNYIKPVCSLKQKNEDDLEPEQFCENSSLVRNHIDEDLPMRYGFGMSPNLSNYIKPVCSLKQKNEDDLEPEQFYENSPLVRNYISKYVRKFRDFNTDKKMNIIKDYIAKTYFRLCETTTLDQQNPLFAKWEALALILIQTQCPEVQSVHQLLDDKCYRQLRESFSRAHLPAELLEAKLRYFEIGRGFCQTLALLQDLFMKQQSSNDDSIAAFYNHLLTQLKDWEEAKEQYYKNHLINKKSMDLEWSCGNLIDFK